jgi:hypothetical protein
MLKKWCYKIDIFLIIRDPIDQENWSLPNLLWTDFLKIYYYRIKFKINF